MRLLCMIFGAFLKTSRLIYSDTFGVCWEVPPGGIKWGVIWRRSSDRSCGATRDSTHDSAFPDGIAFYAAHCPSIVIPSLPRLARVDRRLMRYAADSGAPRPDAPAGSPAGSPPVGQAGRRSARRRACDRR